jgi:hypothetical protein
LEPWRRKASTAFPELRDELEEAEYTVYLLLFDLRSRFRDACASGDAEGIVRIFQFAAWCLEQDDDLPGAAIACFYEHVFGDCTDWKMILGYISAEQVASWWALWEVGLGPVEMRRFYKLIDGRYGSDAPQPPKRWYLEDLDVDDEALATRAAWRQANMPQLLRASLEGYTAGVRSLEHLLDETLVILWEMTQFGHPSWLGRAWEIRRQIQEHYDDATGEGRLAQRELTLLERADIDRLVAELRSVVQNLDEDGRSGFW